MANATAEKAPRRSGMRLGCALRGCKRPENEPSAQGRYWMARSRYLLSVAISRKAPVLIA